MAKSQIEFEPRYVEPRYVITLWAGLYPAPHRLASGPGFDFEWEELAKENKRKLLDIVGETGLGYTLSDCTGHYSFVNEPSVKLEFIAASHDVPVVSALAKRYVEAAEQDCVYLTARMEELAVIA